MKGRGRLFPTVGVALALLAFIAGRAEATAPAPSGERFQLWNDCRPVVVVVGLDEETTTSTSIEKDSVAVAVRSRMREALLYTEDPFEARGSVLEVTVNVTARSSSILVRFHKFMRDGYLGEWGHANTWIVGADGIQSDPASIRYAVMAAMDQFVDAYLSVNEDACRANDAEKPG